MFNNFFCDIQIRMSCTNVFVKILVCTIIFFFSATIYITFLFKFINPPLTPLMLVRYFEKNEKIKVKRIKKDWVAFEKISPNVVKAVIAAEDNKFLQHNGFDFEAIKKAYAHNKKSSRKRGASTISQQTAKNVFLFPSRTYTRKLLEVYFTFLIEKIWGKKRIMTVYLNVIEMGIGVYGIEAAAEYYFNKSALQLSKSEAALIASSLPSPRKYNPKNPSDFLRGRQQKVIQIMNGLGKIDL
jgi:monofunctional glycosyltransferase